MPIKSTKKAVSEPIENQEDFDFDDFDDFNEEDFEIDEKFEADVDDLVPYIDEHNEHEVLQKERGELINTLLKEDEDELNKWLIKVNRSWKQEAIISDVLFFAVQRCSFAFFSSLLAKAFRELGMTKMDDSPIFMKELDLLTFHYEARKFKISFDELIQRALLLSHPALNGDLPDVSSKQGIALVFHTLFSWVEDLSSSQRARLLILKDRALEDDAARRPYWSSFFWGDTSRKEEIDGYFRDYDVATALAFTLGHGALNSTASECLFLKFIQEIKKDIKQNPCLAEAPGYALIDLFDEHTHKGLYCKHFHDAILVSQNEVEKAHEQKPCQLTQSSPF
ncbi:hypothetical protein ACD661_04955 [Legionella lytica]|uniref:Uncharacterized protein n=1 Tax=Legionella lytica TaxID=96232 RepID=A0ABW8D5F6_9GAMM